MKSQLVNSRTSLHALLLPILLLFTPGSNSTSKLHLDEVIGDVVEKLFGAVVQDEFSELMDNCPDAYAALKKSGDCISNRNLSYQRFIRPSPDPSDVKQLCDDLSAAGQCLESVIEALKSCTEGKETRSQNIRVVGASLDASLKYFCDNGGSKLNQFFKQGLPQCFIRRPGRHLAKCFPGRITGLASDRHRNNNYWGPIGEDHDFFDAHNCQLLRNHTECAVRTLQKCSPDGVTDVFQGAIETVMDELMCVGEKTEQVQEDSKSGGGAAGGSRLIHRSYLLMPMFALVISGSIAGAWPASSVSF
ncbi:uncharacterized protein LOC124311318 isoform X1 [Daphnia pulicaria]|uniref:uncharacterized protein LOC124311318 isoform X1 n=1 Tax=Daphnia pulicaria TaxID=35523 RepID=UPI001EECC037|nr:uncharacterized protein LOC124311318 isoform X1 [Daphnia pulicaria]